MLPETVDATEYHSTIRRALDYKFEVGLVLLPASLYSCVESVVSESLIWFR